MRIRSDWARNTDLSKRFFLFSLAAAFVFVLLLSRLWYLQTINSERYDRLSEKNRTRYLPVASPRGPVFDRHGRLLVDSRPAFNISVMRQDVEEPEELLDWLSLYLEEDRQLLEERWKAGRRFPVYRPVTLAADVERSTLERVMENSFELAGILPVVHPIRHYPYGDMGAHVIGTLGEVGEEELRSGDYRSGEYQGKSGIEKVFEEYLRGQDGVRRVEVDARGKELRQWEVEPPKPGNKLFLSLDAPLQKVAQEAFGREAGSAVVMDVRTGELLAVVNSPSFDPALFARGIRSEEWKALLEDPMKPLQNRAFRGQYPPGSTFKPVVMLAALAEGAASSATTVDCQGSFEIGGRVFRCWKKGGHGLTNLKKALRESCDVWFYEVGLRLGIDGISEMAKQLGLGQETGIAIGGESSGLVPSRSWKKERFGAPWYKGETLNASIGQGFLLTTPLQLAVMTAAIANGGTVLKPYLVSRVEDWEGNLLFEQQPSVLRKTKLNPAQVETVHRAMTAVVNEPGGSGWRSRLSDVLVAGKTGTAQVVRLKEDDGDEADYESIPYRFRDHALFIAFAPADKPEIALAVIVEHGGGGGRTAAPIAGEILKGYFARREQGEAKKTPPAQGREGGNP